MLTFIAGGRPQYTKIAPLLRACVARGIEAEWLDLRQQKDLFADLDAYGIPFPAAQTFNRVGYDGPLSVYYSLPVLADFLSRTKPSRVICVGDMTSTAVAALAARYARRPLAHVEAGLRSNNAYLENGHRILADQFADWNFCTTAQARMILQDEGLNGFVVGNVTHEQLAYQRTANRIGVLSNGPYALCTIHRAEAFRSGLAERLVAECEEAAIHYGLELIRIRHPREEKALGVTYPPMAPDTFAAMLHGASLVLTDSGGLQDEAKALDLPTVILRNATERKLGPRQVLGTSSIVKMAGHVMADPRPRQLQLDTGVSNKILDVLTGS